MSRVMKNSGIVGVGSIPETWESTKIFFMCNDVYAGGTPDTAKESYYGGDIPWIASGKCQDCDILDETKFITEEGLNNSSTKMIPANTTLLAMTGATCGKTGFLRINGCANQSVTAFVENKNKSDGRYLYYGLQTVNTQILLNKTGGAQGGINVEDCKNIKLPYPPLEEQQKISDYLDKKCNKIDEQKANYEKSIELLRKYKDSLIIESVTKGLNKDVELKESNIDWIGQIPLHRSLIPFKRLLNERNERNDPIQTDERLSLSIGKGITTYAEKTTNLDRFKDDVSQYKLAYKGDFVMNSMNMIVGAVGVSDYFGCVSPAYYTFYDNYEDNIVCRFCNYVFLSKTLQRKLFSIGKGIMAIDRGEGQVNTCRLKVSKNDLGTLRIPTPPIEEMRKIVKHLDKTILKIDKVISYREEMIEKLEEYKKSLIYECVTGKKELL